MTLWPCRVLRKHGLAEDAIHNALKGICAIFVDGVVLGDEDTIPVASEGRRFVSFRHSICGALILFEQAGWKGVTDGVLARMLDRGSPWRAPDGGWTHSDARPTQSDLYSGLYAIQLLDAARMCADVSAELSEAVMRPLEESLAYLAHAWETDGWSYGRLTSQESFPLSFAEVSTVLWERRPALFAAVADELLLYRNPVGDLQEEYRTYVDPTVSIESCRARLAYSTYLALHPRTVWGGFAQRALAGNIDTLNSVEIAWLLDLELTESVSAR